MNQSLYNNEELFFIEGDAGKFFAGNQTDIFDVLPQRQAVGILGGFYGDSAPICFISRFMLDYLHYTYDEFMEATQGHYIELIYYKDRDMFVRTQGSQKYFRHQYRMVNKQGEQVWVDEIRKDSVSADGKKIWISAVRFIDEGYRREMELLEALGGEFASIIYVDLKQHTFEWVKRQHILSPTLSNGSLHDLKVEMQNYLKSYVHPEDGEVRKLFQLVLENSPVDLMKKRYQTSYRRRTANRYEWMRLNVVLGGNVGMDAEYMILAFKNEDAGFCKELELRHRLSDALAKERQENSDRQDFWNKVTNDMRISINTVLETLAVTKQGNISDGTLPEYLKDVENSGRRLLNLVGEVQDFSEIKSGRMVICETDLDLLTLVQEVVELYKPEIEKRRQKIAVDVSTVRHSHVRSDKNALEKILGNLISNASKHSAEGADLSVTVMELPKLRTGYAHYSFAVKDAGMGISEDKLENVFEPFGNDKDNGTDEMPYRGLGLAITKGLVELLRGDIVVNSVIGEGSCFTVTLEMQIREDTLYKRQKPLNLAGMKVLLVVDNAINCNILRKFLVTEHISVEEVMNGQQAVSAFAVKAKGYYDVILMDIQMPIMNGYAATRQIRAMVEHGGADVPIYAVTSDALTEDVQLAMQAGMNGHLKKPLNFEEMREMLASIRK